MNGETASSGVRLTPPYGWIETAGMSSTAPIFGLGCAPKATLLTAIMGGNLQVERCAACDRPLIDHLPSPDEAVSP